VDTIEGALQPYAFGKRFPLKIAVNEGGVWDVIWVHSFETPDGVQCDAVNGWRAQTVYGTWRLET